MTDGELRELQERVELVGRLVEEPGWALLIDRARATVAGKQSRIVQGKCDDHENYVKECSFLEGMDFFVKLPDRMRLELDMQLAEVAAQAEEDEAMLPD